MPLQLGTLVARDRSGAYRYLPESVNTFADRDVVSGVMEEVEFNAAFTFMYSERKNTIAARRYRDDVPAAVKVDRVSRLVELQNQISRKLNRAVIGHTRTVLVEEVSKRSRSQWTGRTDGNTRAVFPKTDNAVCPGKTTTVAITDATSHTLIGENVRAS